MVVAATLVAQAAVSMGTLTLPAIAPRYAAVIGVDPSTIGYQISIVYAGAMFSAAFGGNAVRALGACRTTQVALSAVAAGMLLVMVPSLAVLFPASVLIGLGYGLANPAASHLLVRYTPAQGRNLIFSIKQTGVPLGGILAALAGPAMTGAFGWRSALLLVAMLGLAMTVLLQVPRKQWDDDRAPTTQFRGKLFGGVALIWRAPPLRYLSLAALCFGGVQLCVMAFTVTLLVAEAHYSLVQAGFMLSLVQLSGAFGRIFWGWAADRLRSSMGVLLVLGGIMTLATLALMKLDASWSAAWTTVVLLALGATAIGWNGVFLAEVAHVAPRDQASAATGGALFFTFGGVLIGPSIFAGSYAFLHSYALTFGIAALFSICGMACLLRARSH